MYFYIYLFFFCYYAIYLVSCVTRACIRILKICRPIYSGEYVNRLQICINLKNSLHRRANRFYFKFTEKHIVHNTLHVICPFYANRCLVLYTILWKYTRKPANCDIYFMLKLLVEIDIMCMSSRHKFTQTRAALENLIFIHQQTAWSLIVLVFYNLIN